MIQGLIHLMGFTCQCNMFQNMGTCWHDPTYKPSRRVVVEINTDPIAVQRMKRWVNENRQKHQTEDERKK